MSKGYLDFNKDPDSPEAREHRKDFLKRMEKKLAYKESMQTPIYR